jgi:hypothetical protein
MHMIFFIKFILANFIPTIKKACDFHMLKGRASFLYIRFKENFPIQFREKL